MLYTLEAEIFPNGEIKLLEPLNLAQKAKAFVTILTQPERQMLSSQDDELLVNIAKSMPKLSCFNGEDPMMLQREMRDEWR